ncbi:MAG: IS110-like element ISDha12 family transposase [Chloroflexota bacterium]
MRGVVGLDVGSDAVSVCVLTEDGRELGRRGEIANSETGARELLDRLTPLAEAEGITEWRIGLEASSLYWWPLALHLSTATRGPATTVFALNPHVVKAFRAVIGNPPKTDRHDAYLIAEWVRLDRNLPVPFSVDWRYAPLQRLTRYRLHLASTLAREKNYFLTMLFLPFSGFVSSQSFHDPFSPTSWAVLEAFTTDALARTPIEELVAYLQQHGRNQFKDPTATASRLQQAAKDSYRLHAALDEPMRLVLGSTRATIDTLQQQLKAIDRTIARELTGIPQTLSTVPGLGPVWTAGLVAEIGPISRFMNDAALAQFAGLTWTVHESGHFQADDTRMTKRGNRYLRYYLIEAANSVREHCPEYRTYYEAKVQQSPTHAHKRSLVLTARKLVRLVDALLRTDTIYQPPEHRKPRKETAPRTQRPARHHRTRPVSATR